MQKIMYIDNFNNGHNDKVENITDLLEKGWKIIKITCANDGTEGGIGGFVILEKENDDSERSG